MLIFYITVVIGILVFGAMLYSIIYHRKSVGHKPAKFHESTKVEIIWTVIPFLILVGMAIPANNALIMMEDTRDSEITLKVTGYQWMWQYEYLEDNISFFSKIDTKSNTARRLNSGVDVTKVDNYLRDVDNYVVLPTDTKVRVLLTASDVIHAWWVPELGGKKDAIPGYVNELWVDIQEPGIYRGQCAECPEPGCLERIPCHQKTRSNPSVLRTNYPSPSWTIRCRSSSRVPCPMSGTDLSPPSAGFSMR